MGRGYDDVYFQNRIQQKQSEKWSSLPCLDKKQKACYNNYILIDWNKKHELFCSQFTCILLLLLISKVIVVFAAFYLIDLLSPAV